MLLIEGLSNAAAGTIKQRENPLLEQAAKLVSKCLGEDMMWEVPVEKKQGQKHKVLVLLT